MKKERRLQCGKDSDSTFSTVNTLLCCLDCDSTFSTVIHFFVACMVTAPLVQLYTSLLLGW